MLDKLMNLREEVKERLDSADSIQSIVDTKVEYLGKKGKLTDILKEMGKLSAEERPKMGKVANEIRDYLEGSIEEKMTELKEAEKQATIEKDTWTLQFLKSKRTLAIFTP